MLINNFDIEIVERKVKNINLKVYPDMKIKVSIPKNMDIKKLERMIISKEQWIINQLSRYEEQNRITKRNYVSGEDHYLNGKRYILKVCDSNKPSIEIQNNKTIVMNVRKSSSLENKERLMNSFYKDFLSKKIAKFVPIIEKQIGIKAEKIIIRKMKNKWGSCNTENKQIIVNLELAKKTDAQIKYVVIHEMLHLIEKKHNDEFKKLMDLYCPKWELYHESLNEILNTNKSN